MSIFIFCVIFLQGLCIADANYARPVVKTPFGKVRGSYSVSYNGETFSQFLGIPYAQPPLGNLRFRDPQPVQPWLGTWEANMSTICIQISHAPEPEGGIFTGEEDCLHLNIYVPGKKPSEKNLKDVVVHIHGGAFNFGHGDSYAGPKYLMDKNVVFVTFNYRLGPLGFLSTEDEVVPGNTGMKDQVAALKWIKDNIKYFGGNPDSVTITGLSAGGASVHYHYLSPLSKDLFKAGISISGTALCPWTLQEAPLAKAKTLAVSVGCTIQSTNELIDCLRQRSARQIVENTRMFRPWLYNPFSPFGIVVEKVGENPFLNEHPCTLLSKGKVHDLPWITSVTSDEGLYPGADYVAKDHYLPELEQKWKELAPYVLDYDFTISPEQKLSVADKIKSYYLKDRPISKETFPELIQLMGDRLFVVDAEKAARLQAKANKSPVYFYYFSYSGEKVPTHAIYFSQSDVKYGVCHGDDTLYILSNPKETKPISKMTENDEKMKETLLDVWFTFAKSGIPVVKNVNWTPVSTNENDLLNYLHIRSPAEITMEKTEEMGHRSFWDSLPFEENDNLVTKAQKQEL